jgi:hypothetical protein
MRLPPGTTLRRSHEKFLKTSRQLRDTLRKHRGRTIRVGRRTWAALQFLAVGSLMAAAAPTGLKKKLSACRQHSQYPRACSSSTTDLYLSSAPTDGLSLYLKF